MNDLLLFLPFLINHLQAWQKACTEGWERGWCERNYISGAAMEMIHGMRSQVLAQLRGAGFVRARGPGDIRWVVCVCLSVCVYVCVYVFVCVRILDVCIGLKSVRVYVCVRILDVCVCFPFQILSFI